LAAFLSDGCDHCQALQQEVFSQCNFGFWSIRKGLVLLSLERSVDQAFCQKYNVNGFPTVILLNHDGIELGRTAGYGVGTGVEAWIYRFENATGLNTSTP
jgi:thioredoxin-related protein